jgi:hypothetical protein
MLHCASSLEQNQLSRKASSPPLPLPPNSGKMPRAHGMPLMILYRFLTGPDDSDFCHKITAVLNKGWLLQGNPTLAFDPVQGRMVCGQAVMKEVKDADYQADMKLSDY